MWKNVIYKNKTTLKNVYIMRTLATYIHDKLGQRTIIYHGKYKQRNMTQIF